MELVCFFSIAFPSREISKSFEYFLSNDLASLLDSDAGFLKTMDRDVLKETLLKPCPGSEDFPSIYAIQWYEVVETIDEDCIYSFRVPDWWSKDLGRGFTGGVIRPIFDYFVKERLGEEDRDATFFVKGGFVSP